ncbi:hypothetical protein [Pseudomonas kurunegalensis]|uniref:hypothetical protein n=1 Tax=Pseudomonas kurunegalensis TaxID=485880 RepID=UPI0023637745|nr:hypothetical protein [Pseudomonas kurunegalensis]MDD2135657.1 hypothetical protein [Pseudomonas kurunegalensis]
MNDLDKQRMYALRDVWGNPKTDQDTKLSCFAEFVELAKKYGVDVRAMLAPFAEEMIRAAIADQREAVAALDDGELTKEKLVEASRKVALASELLGLWVQDRNVSTGNPP